jgi:hypothetical protein
MADSFWYTLYTYNLNCLKPAILGQKKLAVHKTASPARMERQSHRQTVPQQHSTPPTATHERLPLLMKGVLTTQILLEGVLTG